VRRSMTTLRRPMCDAVFDAAELHMEWGVRCPKCLERVRLSNPYGGRVAVLSVLIAFGILRVIGVRAAVALIAVTILISIPVSLLLNAASMRIKSPTLKKWKPRRRTLFEWLYERDAPPDLFDKRRR